MVNRNATDSHVNASNKWQPADIRGKNPTPQSTLIRLCEELCLDSEVARNWLFSGITASNKESLYLCKMAQRRPDAEKTARFSAQGNVSPVIIV
jgi:hypothetical protein